MSSVTTKLWKCDRCDLGLIINLDEKSETGVLIAEGWQKVSIGDINDLHKPQVRDLCGKCVRRFVAFMETPSTPVTFLPPDSQTTETNV